MLVSLKGDTMNRQIATVLGVWLVAGATPAVSAQSTQATQQSQPATQQTTSQTTPRQAAPTQAGSTSSSQSASSAQTADKKVWTNEDVGDLRDHAPISTVGNSAPKTGKSADKAAAPAKGKSAKWYIDQIQALQAKLPPLNDKIQQLQAALNGDQVNSTRQYGGVKPDDWKDQLQRLQKQRDDLQAKIAALEDQARHDGVAPNLLPQQ